jgi:hypothetical protein
MTGMRVGKVSDQPGINLVCFRFSKGMSLGKILNQYRINDISGLPLFQEKIKQSQMVPASRFHKELRMLSLFSEIKKTIKPFFCHWKIENVLSVVSGIQDTKGGFIFGYVDGNNRIHRRTSQVGFKRVPNPISCLTEALKLNQPIGIQGTVGRLLIKLFSLENMKPSAPNFNACKIILT